MQQLKNDTINMKKEDPVRYRYDIEWNEDALKHLKQKALVQ